MRWHRTRCVRRRDTDAEEISLHIVPALGRHRLDVLRPQHLSEFYRDRARVLSVGSVRRLHAVLRRALNVAVRWQMISVNPATLVQPPSLKYQEVQPYTVDEARASWQPRTAIAFTLAGYSPSPSACARASP